MNLAMTESKCEKMSELEDVSIDILLRAIKDEGDVEDKTVKRAMTALNVVGKNRQTLSHRQGVGFAIARAVMTDEELRKYATVTTPEIKKLLKAS